jgi:hypothetical protein
MSKSRKKPTEASKAKAAENKIAEQVQSEPALNDGAVPVLAESPDPELNLQTTEPTELQAAVAEASAQVDQTEVPDDKVKVMNAGSNITELKDSDDLPGNDDGFGNKPYEERSEEERKVGDFINSDIVEVSQDKSQKDIERDHSEHTEVQKEADIK